MSRSCVLIHGFAGVPSVWDRVVERLPFDGTILRPTVAGHGGEEWPGAVETFDDEVDRLAADLPAEGRSLLCGYSLGGRLALGLLCRHPERFDAALIVGAHPGLPDGSQSKAERAKADDSWARRIEQDLEAFVEAWEALPLFESQRRLPRDLAENQRRQRGAHRPRALARAMRVLSLGRMPDRGPRLAGLDLPVVAMAGALDVKFSALARELEAALPRGRAEIVPGAGHNVPLEAPEAVAAALGALAGAAG